MLPITVLLQRALRARVKARSREKASIRESLIAKVSEAVGAMNLIKSHGLEPHLDKEVGDLSGAIVIPK